MKQNGHIEAQTSSVSENVAPDGSLTRSQLSKQQRKFHKFDPEHPAPQSLDSAEPLIEELDLDTLDDENAADSARLQGISSEQMVRLRRIGQSAPDYGLWIAIGVGILVFMLAITAFLLNHGMVARMFAHNNRASAETAVVGNAVPVELSAGVLAAIDESTIAEAAKDYAKAIDRLERVQRDGKHVYGLDYHLATLYLKGNDSARAVPLLNRSIIEGEQVAASCNLRGTLASRSGAADQGLPDLAKATQIDPFNTRYFFDWGEALRRAGNPRAALGQLKRAVDRLQDPSLVPWYSLKIRLTELELGQEDAFVDELDARLKQTSPPVDWLLTAAAVEMRRSDFPAAAEYLNRLCASIGEHETMKQLQDVYFAGFAHEKALVRFYEGSTPPVNVTPP